jgi:hypothetical protein
MAAISPSGEPSMKKGHADRPLGGPGTTDLTAQRCDTLHASPSPCFVAKQDAVSNTASFAGPLAWLDVPNIARRAVTSMRDRPFACSEWHKVPHCCMQYFACIKTYSKLCTVFTLPSSPPNILCVPNNLVPSLLPAHTHFPAFRSRRREYNSGEYNLDNYVINLTWHPNGIPGPTNK